MKKLLLCFVLGLFSIGISAQTKKLITEINILQPRQTITFKYNAKNQLIYFDEKGVVTYREFTLKYDKTGSQLMECLMNRDKGEMIINSKFLYGNDGYITEEAKSSGRQLRKMTDYNKIFTDNSGRLTKTTFEDGKLWEEFSYDGNNNLTKYLTHSASAKNDINIDYSFDTYVSVLSGMENFPLWFWALHMNNMRWCSDFIGNNNAIESTTIDSRFGTETIEITYDYDTDGYPVKQYYDGELVKEFKYK